MTMPNGQSKLEATVALIDANPELGPSAIKALFEQTHGEPVGDTTVREARKQYEAEVANNAQAEAEDPEREAEIEEEIREDGEELGEQIAEDLGVNDDEADASSDSDEDVTDESHEGDSPDEADSGKVGETNEPIVETIVIDRVPVEGRCNHRMPRAKTPDLCGRPEGHPGVHTTYAKLEEKKEYSKSRAKIRYAEDPNYRERAKAASRESHKKARDKAKAEKQEAEADAPQTTEDAVTEGAA